MRQDNSDAVAFTGAFIGSIVGTIVGGIVGAIIVCRTQILNCGYSGVIFALIGSLVGSLVGGFIGALLWELIASERGWIRRRAEDSAGSNSLGCSGWCLGTAVGFFAVWGIYILL